MPETPDTDHFGFTRVGEGEQLSKNGFAALDLDRVALDDLLHALVEHSHDNSPRLPDPAGPPSLIGRPEGGTLPPGTTLYYRVSYLDRWGLETAASTEAAVTTPMPLEGPNAIALNLETSSGVLGPGLYTYLATFVTSTGGETTPGPRADIRIESGSTNRVRMDLPDRIPGATSIRVYRAKPGQTQHYFLFESDQDVLYDDGIQEDPTITSPGFNTTNASNSVEVIVPGAAIPPGVFGWKLYRSTTPGTYSGFNLVHVVVEGTTSAGDDIRVNWIDTGGALQRGEPKEISSTIGGGRIIDLTAFSGRFPLHSIPRGVRSWDQFIPGAVALGRVYSRFRSKYPISPTEISAYFLTPPVTDPAGAQVSIQVVDSTGLAVTMETDGSNGNYYVRTLPITDEAVLEAEKGQRPTESFVPILTDLKASNGQAVELNSVDEYVQLPVGLLDGGRYQAYAWVRATLPGAPTPNDLVISALVTGTTTVLGTQAFSLGPTDDNDYVLVGPVPFVATGDQNVTLRVSKATAGAGTYLVDRVRYQAVLTNLAPGDITLRAEVGDLPGQEYPHEPPPVGPGFVFTDSVAIFTPRRTTATVAFQTNGTVDDDWTVTNNVPWLIVTPVTGRGRAGTLTLDADFTTITAGQRLTGTISIAGTTHSAATLTVVALRDPDTTGADVNVTVHY